MMFLQCVIGPLAVSQHPARKKHAIDTRSWVMLQLSSFAERAQHRVWDLVRNAPKANAALSVGGAGSSAMRIMKQ
jgi:hypothetical protein